MQTLMDKRWRFSMKNSALAGFLPVAALCAAAPLSAQDAPELDYAAVGQATAPVADAYLAAYTSRKWDALEPILAEDADFRDPTATLVFGGILSEGRAAIMDRFRNGYSHITHMEFVTDSRMISGEIGIYQGVLHWGLDIGEGKTVDSATPMVIVLTVENGKVVHHRDYVDYAPFIAGYEALKGPGEEE